MSKVTQLLEILDGIKLEELKFNDHDRLRLVETTKKLLNRVQTNEERLYDITFSQPIVFAALQTLTDLGLWKQWGEIHGVSKSVDELCDLCTPKCDGNLLRTTVPP